MVHETGLNQSMSQTGTNAADRGICMSSSGDSWGMYGTNVWAYDMMGRSVEMSLCWTVRKKSKFSFLTPWLPVFQGSFFSCSLVLPIKLDLVFQRNGEAFSSFWGRNFLLPHQSSYHGMVAQFVCIFYSLSRCLLVKFWRQKKEPMDDALWTRP